MTTREKDNVGTQSPSAKPTSAYLRQLPKMFSLPAVEAQATYMHSLMVSPSCIKQLSVGWYLECEVSPVSISPGSPEVLEAVSVRGSGPRCNHSGCRGAVEQCACG